MSIAVFAGTFDPFTLGHSDIVKRASKIFDKVIVAVASDNNKSLTRPIETRMEIVKVSVDGIKGVCVEAFDGFLADFVKKVGADVIIRGLRNGFDFEYERPLCEVYREQNTDLECLYLIADRNVSHISSSIVRQIVSLGGNIGGYICPNAEKLILEFYKS